MKLFKSIAVALLIIFGLTGCYTQLQYSQKMRRVSDQESVDGYSWQGHERAEDGSEYYDDSSERSSTYDSYYGEDNYIPVYYKNYQTANYWDNCRCNMYDYGDGYMDGYRDGFFNNSSYYSPFYSNYFSFGFGYRPYYGSRFGFSFGFGSYYHPFYSGYYNYYNPFYYDPFGYNPFGYGSYYGYNNYYNYGYYTPGYYGQDDEYNKPRRSGHRSTGISRAGKRSRRSSDDNATRVRSSATRSGTRSSTPTNVRTRSRNSSGSNSHGTVERGRTRTRSRGTSHATPTRTRSRSSSSAGRSGSSHIRSRSRSDNHERTSSIGFRSKTQQTPVRTRSVRSSNRDEMQRAVKSANHQTSSGFWEHVKRAFVPSPDNSRSVRSRSYRGHSFDDDHENFNNTVNERSRSRSGNRSHTTTTSHRSATPQHTRSPSRSSSTSHTRSRSSSRTRSSGSRSRSR